MKQNLCEWLPFKFDTLCNPKLHAEYIIYVPAMLRSKYFLAKTGYIAPHEFNLLTSLAYAWQTTTIFFKRAHCSTINIINKHEFLKV